MAYQTDKRNKEDMRVQRTKKLLTDVFQELVSEKLFEEITVNELCDRAGIRRATFYKHFEDKDSFLVYVVKQLRDGFDRYIWLNKKPGTTLEYYKAYVKSLISFVNYYEKIFNGVINSNVSYHIIEIIAEENYSETKARLQESVREGMKLPAKAETVALMLTGGIASMIWRWIKSGKTMPMEELCDEIMSVMSAYQKE